jgi:hypothetical protein
MQSVKCPYCNSTKTRLTTKEISTGWQVGLSNILVAKYQKEQKATFTEMEFGANNMNRGAVSLVSFKDPTIARNLPGV